ncbi:MAG: hypothetical protein FE834_05855 [Gammaproteobacteria bacterium]|nr:hypothetical protein [Gammaproteobacteria bacterium]
MPKNQLLTTGDTAFNERLLPVFEHTDIMAWTQTFDKIKTLKTNVIIPGHGHPTNLPTMTKFTKDY